jgi:predicted SnoaL-like aldol condensation-catalyzing enzyme
VKPISLVVTTNDLIYLLPKKLFIMDKQLEQNKKNAIEFYSMAFHGNPKEATERYVGNNYKQHNPVAKDGISGFIEYFEKMNKEYPEKSIEFVRSVAEDDLVVLHTHQIWPNNEEYVTMDFFRFDEKGKIVEHWDAVQKIPDQSENENTMY